MDRARGVVGTAAHDGEGLEAGDRAGTDDGAVGGQLAEPAARDAETGKDLIVKVTTAGVSRPEVEAIVRDQPTTPVKRYAK